MNVKKIGFITLLISCSLLAQVTPQNQKVIDQCKSLEDDQPQKAVSFAKETLTTLTQSNNPLYYAHISGCLGWALAMNNQLDLSRIEAERLEKFTNKLTASSQKASIYMRTGGIFHLLGDRISASSNYNKAYLVAEDLNLQKEMIPILVNLGVLNSELKEHKAAIDNYNYALDLMKKTNDFRYKPPVLFNLALTLNGQKMHLKGLEIFLQIESLIDENWPKGRISQVYSGLASSYLGLSDFANAKLYNDKTLVLHNEIGVQNDVKIMTEVSQAIILQQLGQHSLSKTYAKNAYNYYLTPEGQKGLIIGNNSLNLLASYFEESGELNKSIEIYKLSLKLNNNFQDSFNKESIAQMQARLINSQQREELLDLKHNNTIEKLKSEQLRDKNQRELLIAAIFLVLLVAFLIWLRLLNFRLKKATLRDSLTQLGNRRALNIWLSKNLNKANSNRLLWMLDLDNFKTINDKYGHDKGDLVLIGVSTYLSQLKTKINFIGRWGGEEFILITDDISPDNIRHFANDILHNISQLQFTNQNKDLCITASIGISNVIGNTKESWETSLNNADTALYQAKGSGRNCFVVFES